MIEATVYQTHKGAFFLEPRHLQQLDEVLSKVSIDENRTNIAVSLESARSFKTKTFFDLSSIEKHPVLDRLSIVSLDGETPGKSGYVSINLSRSGVTIRGKMPEDDAEIFLQSISDFCKRARAPYYFLFCTWKSFIEFMIVMPILFLISIFVLPRLALPQGIWYILAYFAFASAASQILIAFVRKGLPTLIVLVGEGVRLRDRRLRVWRWLLPKALWQILLWSAGAVFLYFLAKR